MLSPIKQDILRHKVSGRLLSYYPSMPVDTVRQAAEAVVLEMRGRTDITFDVMVTAGLELAKERLGVNHASA